MGRPRVRDALILLLTLIAWAGIRPASAEGPGTGGRRIRLENERVGPYVLRVVTSPNPPQVETLYVEVRVHDAESGDLVRDAAVRVQAWPLNAGDTQLEAIATHDFAPISSDYAAHLRVPQAGDWMIEIHVDSPAGPASISFQEHVISRSTLAPLISAALPFAGLALLIVIFLAMQRKDDSEGPPSSQD